MELDPTSLSVRDRYKLLIGLIVPRPIAFVSTVSPDGQDNLAPFSFFNGAGSDPMAVLFCPANNADGSEKDTLRNCKPVSEGGTGEFVVNMACEAYERKMAACAEPLGYGENEFEAVGLAGVASAVVKPRRVEGTTAALECRTMRVVRLNEGKPSGGNIVIGEVVHVYVKEGVVNERLHTDVERLGVIGRLGGTGYCRLSERFEMPMGLEALRGG